MQGQQVSHSRLSHTLGAGTSGEVWKGVHALATSCSAAAGRLAQAATACVGSPSRQTVALSSGVSPPPTASTGTGAPGEAATASEEGGAPEPGRSGGRGKGAAGVAAVLVLGVGGGLWMESPDSGAFVGKEWTGPSGYALVELPAGSFTMGSPALEEGRADDETEHRVRLSKGFWMGKTEVTQGLWLAVMGSNPSVEEWKGVSLLGDRLPVQNLSWCDAVSFANKLSAREGLSAAYSGVEQCKSSKGTSVRWDRSRDGYRLPTEAEWEYAALAGKTGPYAGGVSEDGACRVANVADSTASSTFSGWTTFSCDDGVAGPAPVGRYAANPGGLHDMTGNVWEWCWDWYGDYSGTRTDPAGPPSGSSRVIRGGSWRNGSGGARVAERVRRPPGLRSFNLGLRLVRTAG